MKWTTRAGIHIDRAACAWLIRRFIDPSAEFVFVTDPGWLRRTLPCPVGEFMTSPTGTWAVAFSSRW